MGVVCWSGVATPDVQTTTTSESLLDKLLDCFREVFTEPKGLPPSCAHNNSIVLKPSAQLVAIRPYLYQMSQKYELERQRAPMMEPGIVHSSASAFSSPTLLVKKAIGS